MGDRSIQMIPSFLIMLACTSKDELPSPPTGSEDTAPTDITDITDDTGGEDTDPGSTDTAPVDTAPPEDTGPTELAGIDPTTLLVINEFLASSDAGADTGAGPPAVDGDWIELFNLTGDELDLGGFRLVVSVLEDDPHERTFDGGTLLPAGGFLLLRSSAELGFEIPDSGADLAIYTPDGRPINVLRFGEQSPGVSAARLPDGSETWTYTERPTPGITNVPPVPEPFTALAPASDWRYTTGDAAPEGDWTQASYDDLAWSEGPAPLGYGDAHIVTELDYGPDANNKYITTWFRRDVTLERVADVIALSVDLMCDDGAAVYLNGEPVLRYNLPPGLLTSSTFASSAISAPDESAFFSVEIPPDYLVEGVNQIAVEVHQATSDSSDLSFDLSLYGEQLPE